MGKEIGYENMSERIKELRRTMREDQDIKIDREKLKQISKEIDEIIKRWIEKES